MFRLLPALIKLSPLVLLPIQFCEISQYQPASTAHFQKSEAGKLQLLFKLDNDYFKPGSISIISPNKLQARFGIASADLMRYKHRSFDIVINDDMDGTFSLREGATCIESFNVKSDSSQIPPNKTIIGLNKTEPEVKPGHNARQFFAFPYREILYQTIRNTFFHVPMWFVNERTGFVFAGIQHWLFNYR